MLEGISIIQDMSYQTVFAKYKGYKERRHGSRKVPSGHLGQVDFPGSQVPLHAQLPSG